MDAVRIIVVDAQALVADGLRYRLADEPAFIVVAHAHGGKELFEQAEVAAADLVLMDISLPGMDGIDTTRRLHRSHPDLKVLAHSALTDIEYVNSMLIEGAAGYLWKNAPKEELVTAIRTVMDGKRYLSEAVRQSIEKGYAYTEKRMGGEYIGLTPREREIIRLVALEKTNDEIAATLFVSPETIKTHRKNLMTKLNVRSTAGLVKYAVDRCWI